ncbi:barnase inhibitor [Salmonella enterica subsp. enterica]|nr:barstar family protein [Salmonella enterica subsp. enterica serovar Thompson]EDW0277267.1 barstar family protein [Salmonella enterica subsp. enterica serovar Thompson]EDW1371461.1 barstar family protein [Salmonella enterica subsp. enterica]EEM6164787.1 barnase inhibitor [Salmonella enterica subsp. enterica serovar Brazzaville]
MEIMKLGSRVLIDFYKVKIMDDFYDQLSEKLGFPESFGRNGDALIDCLFSLRYPQDEMTSIHVNSEEYLLLELRGFSSVEQKIRDTLVTSIEFVSKKCKEKGQAPSIVLLLRAAD